MYLVISFGFEGRMWGMIVSVPDHCLFFLLIILVTGSDLFRDFKV